MKVIFLSTQHPKRVAQSSILRAHDEVLADGYDVSFICVSNNIFHRWAGKDRQHLKKAKPDWTHVFFWYFPGLLRAFDRRLGSLWGRSLAYTIFDRDLKNSKDIHIIVESGAGSVVALQLIELLQHQDVEATMHYRINDPIDAFRPAPVSVQIAHKRLLSLTHGCSKFVSSSPSPITDTKHIPPGVSDTLLYNRETTDIEKLIFKSLKPKQYIIYSGMYPIGEAILRKLVACFPNKLVVYTGRVDLKISGTEYLGVLNPSDLDQILCHAWAGVMVFPDDRFDWWFWSNKMTAMKFLKLPVFGFLAGNDSDVFSSHPDQTAEFEKAGLSVLSADACSSFKSGSFYSWRSFANKLLRPTL